MDKKSFITLVGVSESNSSLANFGKLSFESLGNLVTLIDEVHKVHSCHAALFY
jgi:hypothetical protein